MYPINTSMMDALLDKMENIIDTLAENNQGEEIELKCLSLNGMTGELKIMVSANAHVQGLEKYDVKIADNSTVIQYRVTVAS